MMFEVLFCVDTDTVTVMLCDSFNCFRSLAIWITDDIESKVTKLNFFFSLYHCFTLQKNNVNDVDHTLQAKGEKCLLKYSFNSLPSR